MYCDEGVYCIVREIQDEETVVVSNISAMLGNISSGENSSEMHWKSPRRKRS